MGNWKWFMFQWGKTTFLKICYCWLYEKGNSYYCQYIIKQAYQFQNCNYCCLVLSPRNLEYPYDSLIGKLGSGRWKKTHTFFKKSMNSPASPSKSQTTSESKSKTKIKSSFTLSEERRVFFLYWWKFKKQSHNIYQLSGTFCNELWAGMGEWILWHHYCGISIMKINEGWKELGR